MLKTNRLTNTQQGKGLQSWSCQLLRQEGRMQLFTVTLKVTEPDVIFWWVSLAWAGVIFNSDQQPLFKPGQSLKRTALNEDQQRAAHQTDPATAPAAFNSLHCARAALPTGPAATPHARVQWAKSHLSAPVGLNQTLVILNRVYCI